MMAIIPCNVMGLDAEQGRADDNIETIRKRFKVFTESSLPVIKYYEPSGKLHKVPIVYAFKDRLCRNHNRLLS